MSKVSAIIICLILLKGSISFSQNRYVDSLINYINTAAPDTHKLSVLTVVIEAISEDAVWSKYNDKLGPLALQLMQSEDAGIQRKAKKHYSDYLNKQNHDYF